MQYVDYEENILADAEEWIEENAEYYDDFDDAWGDMEPIITGFDNHSYYCNTYKAEQAVKDVIWDERVTSELTDIGITADKFLSCPEECDCYVRYIIMNHLYNKIETMWIMAKGEEEEEDEEMVMDFVADILSLVRD